MDKLKQIYDNQEKLMKVLVEKEKVTDENIRIPDNLYFTTQEHFDDRLNQRYLRELGNRFLEELGEALVATTQADYQEELIDGLHFLVEFSIVVGFKPVTLFDYNFKLTKEYREMDELDKLFKYVEMGLYCYTPEDTMAVTGVLKNYGAMMNTLRSKPWKANYDPTDIIGFKYHLNKVWEYFVCLLLDTGITSESAFEIYKNKNKVNFERQENGY